MGLEWKKQVTAYMFILPLLLVFAVFLLYSLIFLLKTGFEYGDISFLHSKYVGLDNYRQVLTDVKFFKSIWNNIVFSAATIVISMTLGFLISVFLWLKFPGSRALHALFFIPTIMPMALIATVFSGMLEYRFGALNQFLESIGMGFLAQQWLGDPNWAYVSVMGIGIYLIGIPMMYYSADITTINPSVLEAAVLEGAGMTRMLGFIIFPLLKNAHKTIIISTLLQSFREFERIYLMTGGGPGDSTQISSVYLYNFIHSAGSNIGFVSAGSVILLLVALVISLFQLRMYAPSQSRKGKAT
ncbi:carbohydrate ABC transporter permease [Paenibacillus whitsoniae]|uniref:Sugar ABC transporter permease n=1 Tax=Paenibacillus whitsoniae TaxID=2496558 RepID=A0A3S0BHJ4_9BACL|nr:sugar ABC transporter permease [Paenibacillus whitsoniae]RTE04309.1 sugar ABC transporter permease [Paenibacillus whitsoniae]